MSRLLIFIVFSVLTSSCVTNIGFLGVASTKSELNTNVKYKQLGNCKATDKVFIFFVPWGVSRIETALRSCLEKYPNAEYISNASIGVYQNNWVLFAWTGFQVQGTVYGRVDSQSPKKLNKNSQEESFILHKDGELLMMTSNLRTESVVAIPR